MKFVPFGEAYRILNREARPILNEDGAIIGMHYEIPFEINYAQTTTEQQMKMAENLRLVCDA